MHSGLIVNSKPATIQTKHMDAGVRIKPTVATQIRSEIVHIYVAFVIIYKFKQYNFILIEFKRLLDYFRNEKLF